MKRVIIIAFATFSFLVFWPGQRFIVSEWKYSDCGGFKSYGERQEFMRLLQKHGLKGRFSVIYDWPENPYYRDENKRRCAFK
jgi:hypothetical protein